MYAVGESVFVSLPLLFVHSEVELKFDFSVSCRVLRDALGRRYGVRNPSFYGLRHQGRFGSACSQFVRCGDNIPSFCSFAPLSISLLSTCTASFS